MFLARPFIRAKLPSFHLNELPLSITHKTGELLSKKIKFINQPQVQLYENEFEFFMQCEPITKNEYIKDNIDLLKINNFFRDVRFDNKGTFYFFRSWFCLEDEKCLVFYNALEILNHPTICTQSVKYMFLVSEQAIFPKIKNADDFLTQLSKLK